MSSKPRFSILHTSARPNAWRAVYDAWLAAADRPEDVEYILVVDERWGFTSEGFPLLLANDPNPPKVVWNTGRRCYVEGVNLAAKHATGDILIVVADDQFPCEHWDTRINWAGGEFVVWAPTGTPSEFEREIIVMPIMSRALYEKWGYVFYPGYESMYADNDLCEHAKAEGVLIQARHLPVFPHKHFLFTPGVELDAAYEAQNRPEAYTQGQALLESRRLNHFKDVHALVPPTPIRSAVAKPAGGDTRPSIQPCIPGEVFSRDWVMAWTYLLPVLSQVFRLLPPVTAYSSAPHVTRQGIREEILRGEIPDFVLWLDDDNILSPDGLLQLYADMVEHPEIQLAAGWSWDSIGASITAGLQLPDGTFGRIEHQTMMAGPDDLFKVDWTGFPAVLMRGSLLVEAGPMAFIPMPTGPPWYLYGEDISFCMRVKDQLKVIDRRVRVPHLKLRDNKPALALKSNTERLTLSWPEAKKLETAGTPA